MRCCKCKYYYSNCQDFNTCTLLKWECSREIDDCKVINDDGTINKEEYDDVMQYM